MARKNFTLEISGAVPPLLRCRLGCGECEGYSQKWKGMREGMGWGLLAAVVQ